MEIAEPGGGKLRIAPQTGGLPYVQGQTVTPRGLVGVSWQPQYWRLEVTLPAAVSAEVKLPATCEGKRIAIVESAGEVTHVAGRIFTIAGPGRYVFQVR
ncbi:MAG: hypothetical protein M1546_06780 [Chloroflexi bacterium]|nr:hypothetical protein [Chloroflexota bacterium]